MDLFKKIKNLGDFRVLSKKEQIIQGVSDAIDEGVLKKGDMLPSINQMVEETGFARKTIVRGYNGLREKGYIDSLPQKGYFVTSEETSISTKIVLLFYELGQIQENFYNTLKNHLGNKFSVDIFFHHNDLVQFKSLIDRVKGKYGKYIIAPIENDSVIPTLKEFSDKKLMLVDRYVELEKNYSYVVQEFENSIFNGLMDIFSNTQSYKKLIFFYDKNPILPQGIIKAVKRFASLNKVPVHIMDKYKTELLEKNTVFFVLSDNLLWKIIADCKSNNLKIGKEIGLLGHNDDVVKEIIVDGITTLGADFKLMAKITANHILTGKTIQTFLPINLIRRNSI